MQSILIQYWVYDQVIYGTDVMYSALYSMLYSMQSVLISAHNWLCAPNLIR